MKVCHLFRTHMITNFHYYRYKTELSVVKCTQNVEWGISQMFELNCNFDLRHNVQMCTRSSRLKYTLNSATLLIVEFNLLENLALHFWFMNPCIVLIMANVECAMVVSLKKRKMFHFVHFWFRCVRYNKLLWKWRWFNL